MIKIIIGFIALLILLAASYIIFVDQTKSDPKELKEHFYPAPPGEGINVSRNVCGKFNKNPKTFIEDNSNFMEKLSEPDDTSEKMKSRYNQMYNQCFMRENNTNDPNNCGSVYIGEIPTSYTDEFGAKIINCISNDSCDVIDVDSQCDLKGTDCSSYNDKKSCNDKEYCSYENDSCQFKGNLCGNYERSECESDKNKVYCTYNDKWNYCDSKTCFINENKESCLSNDNENGCVWDGSYCSNFNCTNVSIDDCLSNNQCVLKPLDQSEAKCVPK